MKEKIAKMINKLLKKDKWKMYLYYNNQFIKKVYRDENFELRDGVFIIRVFFKKHLFGSNNIKTVCKFDKVKFYDDINKVIHCEVNLYGGKEVR